MSPRRSIAALSLAFALGLGLGGCAPWRAPAESIVEVSTGRTVPRAELVERLRAADLVLLGELHDNRRHHVLRGELIVDLGSSTVVVAEHLHRGQRVGAGSDLRARLVAAGFDDRAWRWPVHEPLFGPVLAQGLPVVGGNAPNDQVRQVARNGLSAWPLELQPLAGAAPLAPQAQAALDADLVGGHCGQLPAARVPAMRLSQRLRDAALWSALQSAGGRPSVLVAGNGHVRRDYGVGQYAATLAPQRRSISVGFVEDRAEAVDAPYDFVWVTAPAEREDPCIGLRMKN